MSNTDGKPETAAAEGADKKVELTERQKAGIPPGVSIPEELIEYIPEWGLIPDVNVEKPPVKVKATDEVVVIFSAKALAMSHVLTVMNREYPGQIIPIHLVKGETLELVKQYCEEHHSKPFEEIEKPLRSSKLSECGVSKWDEDFINKNPETLQELILAANYLDVKPLLELCAAKIASLMKGKSVEELRAEFNIENDFSPEEEALIREENRWIDDA